MSEVILQVEYRGQKGKAYRNALFQKDMVPGVVYGKAVGSIPVQVQIKPFRKAVTDAKGGVVDLTVLGPLDGETNNYKVLVKDVQVDPIKQTLMNIDFHQISMDEPVTTTVAINVIGEVEIGVVQHGIRELQISCLPHLIPSELTVDVSELEVGSTIAVQDLTLPEQVDSLDDPETVVVTVVAEQVEEVEKETDEEETDDVAASEEAAETAEEPAE